MKEVQITYNEAINAELIACLTTHGISTYTKIPHVFGVGTHSDPHMGSHVWPGENNMLFIVAEDEAVAKIMDCVRQLKKKKLKEGIKAFLIPVEEVI
ncbi:hypothetical protein BMS3Abin05_02075 [bacterium BMS3Abin05]|nr:hypothetical protein BMS3Abin05_02075 [bacterium BMS3Abin05]GBE27172.1 hypothetical protein BMS3Bbin03_01096 [bacterium BMS3Bbin03]